MQSSGTLVTPNGMAPALFSRATVGASLLASTLAREISPVEQGIPAGEDRQEGKIKYRY